MEPKGYELLKIEAKITILEKELSALFEDFKKYESKKEYNNGKSCISKTAKDECLLFKSTPNL